MFNLDQTPAHRQAYDRQMATQAKPEQPTDDPVLTRLTGVETRLTGVETNLAIVKSNYATKEDIAKLHNAIASGDDNLELKMAQMETRLIKWFIGTAIPLSAVVGTIAFASARFIH
jgi:anti-sigma28 factor (negative regulator of flagellin synthesis)